jgi:hypothetical protein
MIRRNASVPVDEMWENAQLRSLLDRIGAIACSFSCDRLGTGSSEAPSVEVAATLDAWLEDTWAVMAACSAGPVVLVGMGEPAMSDVLFALQDRS